MGRTAVPWVSVAPPLACIDSIRPIPASRFQLMPQAGSASAIIRSALRYAASAIVGMPSAPGEFTTSVGGGADTLASAMWKPTFGCWTAITIGPVGSVEAGATAASGGMAAWRGVGFGPGEGGAAAPTTPAKTRQAIITTPKAGVRAARLSDSRTAATDATRAAGIREASGARTADWRTLVAALTTATGVFRARGARVRPLRLFLRGGGG